MTPPRRVITGLDAAGRSSIILDAPSPAVIWSTQDAIADNNGNADAGGAEMWFPKSGSLFLFSDLPPGVLSPMHATNTIDYTIITSGEVVFITETGEVLLKAGDVLVDRGVMHAWRNDSDQPCRIMSAMLPANPVGAGATVV